MIKALPNGPGALRFVAATGAILSLACGLDVIPVAIPSSCRFRSFCRSRSPPQAPVDSLSAAVLSSGSGSRCYPCAGASESVTAIRVNDVRGSSTLTEADDGIDWLRFDCSTNPLGLQSISLLITVQAFKS